VGSVNDRTEEVDVFSWWGSFTLLRDVVNGQTVIGETVSGMLFIPALDMSSGVLFGRALDTSNGLAVGLLGLGWHAG